MAAKYIEDIDLQEAERKSSDELIEKAKDDWDALNELNERRPQTKFSALMLYANSAQATKLEEVGEITYLKLPSPPAFLPPCPYSLWGLAYKARWMFTQNVFVRQTKSFSTEIRSAILHEMAMTDTFQSISPKIMHFGPVGHQIRIATEYAPSNLKEIMREELSINFNIPSELAEALAVISSKKYLLREFRVEKFLATLSK